MKKSAGLIILSVVWLLCISPAAAATAGEAAARWAPVVCQTDNGDGLSAPQNIFTLVNYDRDWRLNNNWYNLLFYPLERAMYYSVVESDTHYFIGYYQYYPRHIGGGDYEHDLTGVLAAIAKTPVSAGRLAKLVTYSNKKWQKWEGAQVRLEGGHPVLNISPGTHEIAAAGKSGRALPPTAIYGSVSLTGRAKNKALSGEVHGGYSLIPLTQLWERRQDIGQGRVFARWGYFDSFHAVKVSVPWVWEYRQLNWLTKPGELVQYFQGRPVTACKYLSNPYQLSMERRGSALMEK